MPSERIYYPAMAARIRVPPFPSNLEAAQAARNDEPIDIWLHVKSATWEINNHLTADALKLEVEWKDANVDPRFLKNCTVEFWMGDQGGEPQFRPTDATHRFIGVCTKARRQSGEMGHSVELDFLDYTTFFIHCKPMPAGGVPNYNMTLLEAWTLICDHTGFPDFDDPKKTLSSVAGLRNDILFRGGTKNYTLKGNVPARLASLTQVATKPGDSSWDIWQNTVASLGLISYIERDYCVVTSTTEQFADEDAPVFVLGSNVMEAEEMVDVSVSNKGIALSAIDTTTGKVLEAFFPPPGDIRINVKRSVARRKDYKEEDLQSEAYEYYEYHDVLDENQLFEVAKRAYAEKSRQEIQGSIKTREMVVQTKEKKDYDLLFLRAGQLIHIEIDPDDKALLRNVGSHEERVEYLIDHGYEKGVAEIVSRNLDAYPFLNCAYHTKSVVVRLAPESFDIQIHYQNRIQPSGSTQGVGKDEGIGNVENNHDGDASNVLAAKRRVEKGNTRTSLPQSHTTQARKSYYVPPLPSDDIEPTGHRGSGGGGSQDKY